MLQQSYTSTSQPTFLTSIVPVAADVPFHVPYSSALLLPLPDLAPAIVCNHDFVTACEYGHENYFEDMYEWNSTHDDLIYVHKSFTSFEVFAVVQENLRQEMPLPDLEQTTLPWRVGFVFGWLSALAHYQPVQAQHGLCLLVGLVRERRLA